MGDNAWNGTPYDAAIFLDNDEKNINLVASCGNKIATILIPCNERPAVNIDSPTMLEYVNSLSPEGSEAARTIHMMAHAIQSQIESYDPTSGIRASHVEDVKNWVLEQQAENPNKRLAALFDWDRTLTLIEGIWSFGSDGLAGIPRALLPHFKSFKNLPSAMERWNTITPQGFAEYYFGGPERISMLQEMFDFLYEKKVDIFILTYNATCFNNRLLMEEMMNILTRNRHVGYLCASMEKLLNKKRAIQRSGEYSALFETICPDTMKNRYNTENREVNDDEELSKLLNELHSASYRGGYKRRTQKKKQKRSTRKKLNKRMSK